MSIRTTLTLLVILAIVGAAAFFLRPRADVNPWDKPTQNLEDKAHDPLLKTLGVDIHRITRITLMPAGKPALTLERTGDDWRLTAPIALPLKTGQVEGLILAPLRETRDLGYAGPISHVITGGLELATADGAMRLDIGPTTGAGTGLLETGGKTYRTTSDLHDLFANLPPLAALVDPQLDIPPAARVAKLTVASGSSRVAVLRKPGGFVLDQPGSPRASAEAMVAYCSALCALKIVELPQEAQTSAFFGFDHPAAQITLEDADHQTTRVDLGGPTALDAKRHFVRLTKGDGAPLIAVVETAQIVGLPQGENFFRDTRIVLTKPADARRLRVEQDGKTTLDLTLDENGKAVFTDKSAPFAADAKLGKTVFETLLGLKPMKVAAALEHPEYRITLTDAFGREEVFSFSVGKGIYVIQRAGDAESFVVGEAQGKPLLMTAEELRDKANPNP